MIALSGASGSIYAKLLFDRLNQIKDQFTDVGIVASQNAKDIWKHELPDFEFNQHQFKEYSNKDFYAPFASGSAKYNVMIICPSSMGTIGRIANGISDDLITRAADVMLKERGRLIVVPRELPYNLIHIQNMEKITLAGGTICPATPSFYTNPKSIEELALTVVNRVLDLAGFHIDSKRWGP